MEILAKYRSIFPELKIQKYVLQSSFHTIEIFFIYKLSLNGNILNLRHKYPLN